MLTFHCTSCGKKIGLAQRPAGGQAQCPFCNQVTPVPETALEESVPEPGAQRIPLHLRRHMATLVGDTIFVPTGAQIPQHGCAICGTDRDFTVVVKKFTWVNPLAYLGLCGGVLPALILLLVLRKQASLYVPICAPCHKQWRLVDWVGAPALIFGLFALPVLGGVAASTLSTDLVLVGVLTGFVLWIVQWYLTDWVWRRKSQLKLLKIEHDGVQLRHPNPAAVRHLWTDGG